MSSFARFTPLVAPLVDALLPPRCLACATEIPRADAWCAVCREQLVKRGASYAFVEPLAGAIRRAKYSRDVAVARGLAAFWSNDVDVIAACADVDAIAFVPAHLWRRLSRGFDFPAVLASALSTTTKKPLLEALTATRRDPRLADSADRDARSRIVAGRFVARKDVASYEGKVVAVVDDVFTTGATLAEACRVIEAAGVKTRPLTLAQTPLFTAERGANANVVDEV